MAMVCYLYGLLLSRVSILEEIQAIANKLSESTPKLGTASPGGDEEAV